MSITITRRLEFDAAHRVLGHESKCANLHGHRYVVEVYATPVENLDELGRVIDFSVLKAKLGAWIDEHWDHTAILYSNDEEACTAVSKLQVNKNIFIMNSNPTAENMASYLLNVVCWGLFKDDGIRVTAVTVYETPNCRARATLNDKDV